MSGINNTRVYENILGPSTNPNNLDIYNEFVDEDETEEYNIPFVIDNDMSLISPDKPLIGTEPTILSAYQNYLIDAPANPLSLEEFSTLQGTIGGVNL